MTGNDDQLPPAPESLAKRVGIKAERKLRAQQCPGRVWFGLGMMGLIGWSVVTPTLLGAALGLWLDRSRTGAFSWTLSLLVAGLFVGCANAWYWVAKEDLAMRKDRGEQDA